MGLSVMSFLGILVVGAVLLGSKQNAAQVATNETPQSEVALNTNNTQVLGSESEPEGRVSDVDNVNELKIEDIEVGSGEEAVQGKKVKVNYEGRLISGTKFDSSYDRGTAFEFNLGTGEVIQGWDQGVTGMKVGGKRKLTIPPALGYGSADMGVIPPNSTLIFEVELLEVN